MSLTTYKKIRPAKVVVTMASGQVIEGTINIGFEQRVSDFLSASDRSFIPVFKINGTDDVMLVNKAQIASIQHKVESSESLAVDRPLEGLSLVRTDDGPGSRPPRG